LLQVATSGVEDVAARVGDREAAYGHLHQTLRLQCTPATDAPQKRHGPQQQRVSTDHEYVVAVLYRLEEAS
jgi:hypothetical protein